MGKATVSFVMYVCPTAWNNTSPLGGLRKISCWGPLLTSVYIVEVWLKSGNVQEQQRSPL